MPEIEEFKNIPDISFIDDISIESLLNQAVKDFELKYEEVSGTTKKLYPADPIKLIMQTYVLKLYQLYQYVDRAGKQDLLKYSFDGFLDNIASLRGVSRLNEQSAFSTIRFILAKTSNKPSVIPIGTRVCAGDNVFFATIQEAIIPAESEYCDVSVVCLETGEIGNKYDIGDICNLVDPLPYIKQVYNTTPSSGGVSIESDESLSRRTYLAPSGYSVAGPDKAYEFWVRTFSQLISSVNVTSPEPGVVDIRVLVNNGELPDDTFISQLQNYIEDENIRPLTDKVNVDKPEVITYNINATYYINKKDSLNVFNIQQNVMKAVRKFVTWQREAIGRDINPSELTKLIMEAGAKRVHVASPAFTLVPNISVANETEIHLEYGGVEND